MAQVARELGIPTYSCALHCESKTGDFQAGLEKTGGMMSALLSRISLTTNMATVNRRSAASYEQLVTDDELCDYLRRPCSEAVAMLGECAMLSAPQCCGRRRREEE